MAFNFITAITDSMRVMSGTFDLHVLYVPSRELMNPVPPELSACLDFGCHYIHWTGLLDQNTGLNFFLFWRVFLSNIRYREFFLNEL